MNEIDVDEQHSKRVKYDVEQDCYISESMYGMTGEKRYKKYSIENNTHISLLRSGGKKRF
jgi:hypothetical protein